MRDLICDANYWFWHFWAAVDDFVPYVDVLGPYYRRMEIEFYNMIPN